MTPSCPNPALVVVILWGISIAATTFLFMGNPHVVCGIAIQGICMIGSAVYIRKAMAGESFPVPYCLLAVFPAGLKRVGPASCPPALRRLRTWIGPE
jgi:hypothetical protein